jgi:hypothetical protein
MTHVRWHPVWRGTVQHCHLSELHVFVLYFSSVLLPAGMGQVAPTVTLCVCRRKKPAHAHCKRIQCHKSVRPGPAAAAIINMYAHAGAQNQITQYVACTPTHSL